jgi:hypothetical protein
MYIYCYNNSEMTNTLIYYIRDDYSDYYYYSHTKRKLFFNIIYLFLLTLSLHNIVFKSLNRIAKKKT